MRAPGGSGRRDISRGPLLLQRFSPDPRRDWQRILESIAVDCVVITTSSNYSLHMVPGFSCPIVIWYRMAHLRGQAVKKSLVLKRSIVIAGHKTSVSLEGEFWDGEGDRRRTRHNH